MHVFILSILGQTALHLILAFLIWHCTEKGNRWRKFFIRFIIALYIIFICAWSLRSVFPIETLADVLAFFNNYYIFLVLLITYSFLPIALLFILEWMKTITKKRAKSLRSITLITFLPITIILCIWGHYNTIHPIIQRYDIELEHIGEEKELKIAFISDIHIGEFIREKQIKHLVETVKKEQPDYVLFGGDMVDFYFDFVEAQPTITKELKQIHPDPSKIYYCMGNHEYYADTEAKIKWIKTLGNLLMDDAVALEDHLYLVARDDAYNEDRRPLSTILEHVPSDATTILLEHQPGTTDESKSNGIDLALHGHTHNGQFVPFNWAVSARYSKYFGWYQDGASQFIVSSGYGVAGSTFRVGTHSEIVILNIKLRHNPL